MGLISWFEYRIVFWGCGLDWESYGYPTIQDRKVPVLVQALATLLVKPNQWLVRTIVKLTIRGVQWKPLS